MRKIVSIFLLMMLVMLSGCVCEHDFQEISRIEASCAAEGAINYACSKCGEKKADVISMLSHKYSTEVTVAASCTTDGVRTYTCIDCGDSYTKAFPASGHYRKDDGVCKNCKEKLFFTEEEIRNIIQIKTFDVGEYNDEALSEIKIVWRNTSKKTIRNIEFIVTARYGDEKDSFCCKASNIEPNELFGNYTYWEPLWPSDMVGEKITSIKILYTDGTFVHINDSYSFCLKYAFEE